MTAYLYYDLIEANTIWMIFFIGSFLLTVIYFQLLQIKVTKREYPHIISLAGICFMTGFSFSTIILLIIGVSIFEPYMWTMFSLIYIIGTIWIDKKLWTMSDLSR